MPPRDCNHRRRGNTESRFLICKTIIPHPLLKLTAFASNVANLSPLSAPPSQEATDVSVALNVELLIEKSLLKPDFGLLSRRLMIAGCGRGLNPLLAMGNLTLKRMGDGILFELLGSLMSWNMALFQTDFLSVTIATTPNASDHPICFLEQIMIMSKTW